MPMYSWACRAACLRVRKHGTPRTFVSRWRYLGFVQAGIDGVAEAVADEIEGNHRQENEHAGPEDPGMLIELDDVHGLVEHVSPGWGGVHDSQTENGKGRLAQDVAGNAQSSRDHHISGRGW